MVALALAGIVLIVGALLAFVMPKNGLRAAAAIATQAAACVLVAPPLVGVLRSGTAIEGSSPWSYPVETIALRVDALSAFFLVWSLPMTLLGTVYAVGY